MTELAITVVNQDISHVTALNLALTETKIFATDVVNQVTSQEIVPKLMSDQGVMHQSAIIVMRSATLPPNAACS